MNLGVNPQVPDFPGDLGVLLTPQVQNNDHILSLIHISRDIRGRQRNRGTEGRGAGIFTAFSRENIWPRYEHRGVDVKNPPVLDRGIFKEWI